MNGPLRPPWWPTCCGTCLIAGAFRATVLRIRRNRVRCIGRNQCWRPLRRLAGLLAMFEGTLGDPAHDHRQLGARHGCRVERTMISLTSMVAGCRMAKAASSAGSSTASATSDKARRPSATGSCPRPHEGKHPARLPPPMRYHPSRTRQERQNWTRRCTEAMEVYGDGPAIMQSEAPRSVWVTGRLPPHLPSVATSTPSGRASVGAGCVVRCGGQA